MNKFIKCITVIILIICLLSLSGCLSLEERQRGVGLKRTAKAAVNAYLLEKYGFEAKITSVVLETVFYGFGFWPEGQSYTDDAQVTCEYKGKTFQADIDIFHNIIKDDYQLEDIQRDTTAYIQSQFSFDSQPVPQELGVNLIVSGFSPYEWKQDSWYKEQFYDGNIENFIDTMLAESDNMYN